MVVDKLCPMYKMIQIGLLFSLVRNPSVFWDIKAASQLYRSLRKNKDGTPRAGKTYWSVYRKAHRVQAKKYLGQDLTIGALEVMALDLEKDPRTKLGIQDN